MRLAESDTVASLALVDDTVDVDEDVAEGTNQEIIVK